MNKKLRNLCILLLCLVMLAGSAMTVLADKSQWTSPAPHEIDVVLRPTVEGAEKPFPGITVQLFRVADVTVGSEQPLHSLSYTLTPGFQGSGADLAPESLLKPELAAKLYAYAINPKNSIQPTYSAVTDSNGVASFREVDEGLYLVAQVHKGADQFEEYVFNPYLVSIPIRNENLGGGIGYAVESHPKGETILKPERLKVIKIWKGANAADCIPVEIQLTGKCQGKPDILINVTLSKDDVVAGDKNQWALELDRIVPAGYTWTVTEKKVWGFSTKYKGPEMGTSQDHLPMHIFTVTNTYVQYPLVQTGQLKWPVPVLALSGLILIAAGILVSKYGRKKENNENC